MIPDWLQPTFLLLPALLWMFLGVGVPWALALLPRADWYRHVTVLAVALALGPALTTTAMFLIATFSHLTLANVFTASGLVAATGLVLALRQQPLQSSNSAESHLTWIDITLIFVIAVAVVLRFWNTAYWPYDNYDEFWVYGYNAKIFMLQRAIPATMGYYPQLLPLSLTYGQLVWGALSEHAARTVVPFFGLGSILMTYVLGSRLFGRRAGLIGAAVWALYAHHAGWAQYADLEVPVTFYFTGAAAFFIVAWRERNRRYAILGGVLAGAALWTKPTAGALIESVALIAVVSAFPILVRTGDRVVDRLSRVIHTLFDTPIPLFALALLPMGGMWYIRNILFGLPPIILPASYWQDEAQRSGQELGWPLLVIVLLTVYLISRHLKPVSILAGVLFMLAGALPSAFDSPHPHRLTPVEYILIIVGSVIFARAAWTWWRGLHDQTRKTVLLLWAFILPYFVTWFWSYSYHYRLSFAMVPLFTVQVGVLLDRFGSPVIGTRRFRVAVASAIILIAALPGWFAALSGLDVALHGTLPDDHAKQAVANPALITLVDYLEVHRDPSHPLRVEAPGELRLPYFFPADDIRTTRYPTRLDQIADVDYFVDSSVGQRLYLINGKFEYNQIIASLTRDDVLKRQMTKDDGDFRFSVYTVDNLARFKPPHPNVPLDNVQIGDFARLAGWEISGLKNGPGARIFLTLYWQAIKAADLDYSVYIHFWDPLRQKLGGVWGGEPVSGAFSIWQGVPGDHFSMKYHTRLWQDGEYIKDEWVLQIAPDTPSGDYDLRIGLFDAIGGGRLPVTVNGKSMGDGLKLAIFTVTP